MYGYWKTSPPVNESLARFLGVGEKTSTKKVYDETNFPFAEFMSDVAAINALAANR